MPETTLKLSSTQYDFVTSNEIITALIGPQGEGKTFAGFVSILHHRSRQPKEMKSMKCAVIRDTFENIKRMTVPSFRDAADFAKVPTEWREGGKKLILPGIEIDLFGIDSIGALNKIQGAEYSLIHLEEPAPILDKANAGLSKEVFDVAVSRVARQRNAVPRLQITMNPADEDHWTYHTLIEDPFKIDLDGVNISTAVFNIPYGENKQLTDVARALVKVAYKDNPELYQRYVEGKFSFVTAGAKVTPEYNEAIHRAPVKLNPIDGGAFWRCWDGGLNPTMVILEVTPAGRIFVLDAIRGDNIGMRQFIQTQVKPLLARRMYSNDITWLDTGDPALTNKEQSDSEASAAAVIEDELGTQFDPGQTHWHPRRESMKEALTRMVNGEPLILLSQHEGILHRALRGGWHYKTDNNGRVMNDIPLKDIHSHPGDAFSYGIGKILPYKTRFTGTKVNKDRQRKVAKGYAVKR